MVILLGVIETVRRTHNLEYLSVDLRPAFGIDAALPLGLLNLGIFLFIVGWYLVDTAFRRREIYETLFRVDEEPISPVIRLWRMLTLLAVSLGALLSTVLAVHDAANTSSTADRSLLSSSFIIVGVGIAALGWMYTAFRREKAERTTHTLQAIRDQMYGDPIAPIRDQVTALAIHLRAKHGIPKNEPLPVAHMQTPLNALNNDPVLEAARLKGHQHRRLEDLVDSLLDASDQIAFGIRSGQLDFQTVQMVLRPRYVRLAFVFAAYIREETEAEREAKTDRLRSKKRTWEHFLWLVSRLELTEDERDYKKHLVLPPRLRDLG